MPPIKPELIVEAGGKKITTQQLPSAVKPGEMARTINHSLYGRDATIIEVRCNPDDDGGIVNIRPLVIDGLASSAGMNEVDIIGDGQIYEIPNFNSGMGLIGTLALTHYRETEATLPPEPESFLSSVTDSYK